MSVIALVTWILTVAGGLYLLAIWLIEYDRDFQRAAATRLPVPVICAHALLAVTGLIVWIGYLVVDRERLAWLAVIILMSGATLGMIMAIRWIAVYRSFADAKTGAGLATAGQPAGPPDIAAAASAAAAGLTGDVAAANGGAWPGAARTGGTGRPATPRVPPERNFPVPVVIAHGVFAMVTIGLVLLTALGVGGS